MSLSKPYFVIALVLVAALVALRGSEVMTKQADALTTNSWLDHRPFARDDVGSETPSGNFLPVQSQNPDDLGAGKLLIASRTLRDPNFAQTVILLVRSNADGVVGLVLNQRTDIPLSRVLEHFEAGKGRSDFAYLGGPVETSAVFALSRSKAKLDGAEPVLGDTYLISTKSVFEKAIAARPDSASLHVYLGYAGWSNDQLRAEVKTGSWFIFPGDAETVFDSDPDALWREMIQKTELKLVRSDPRALGWLDRLRRPGIQHLFMR
jgi:putative transcriptional regulator